MDTQWLFQTALVSIKLFHVVQFFLEFLGEYEPEEEGQSDSDSDSSDETARQQSYRSSSTDLYLPYDGPDGVADYDNAVSVEHGLTQPHAADSHMLVAEVSDAVMSYDDVDDHHSLSPDTDVDAMEDGIFQTITLIVLGSLTSVSGYAEHLAVLGGLPTELALEVLREMPLADRSRLASTSHLGTILVADALQSTAIHLLLHFRLQFAMVCLLLTATGAAITGSAVTALMRVGSFFFPDDLDFVVGRGKGPWVANFLTLAGYALVNEEAHYLNADGIYRVWTMDLDGLKINVMESLSSNPLDIVAFLNLSCVYGAWFADGIWHGYPHLTTRGIAITTPRRFPVRHGVANHRKGWDIIHKYAVRGFTFQLNEYDEYHKCGTDINCPATL
ncbi:hypothetical protein C8F04DRAFT_1191625 [Mycena alexandri]|uniref:F-box domain-containing protein n=1 Tax=Mycena alexandri TaxID=1745969 RepID=A0AAD6SCE7_9AGAR|nr:hypothetical protein C8F04DRAFT_1191625 [Mycena alexandri]